MLTHLCIIGVWLERSELWVFESSAMAVRVALFIALVFDGKSARIANQVQNHYSQAE